MIDANVTCRRRADCAGSEALCVLSGLTGGTPRGNEDMRAYCLDPAGPPPMMD